MNFGEVIEALKDGKAVNRVSWYKKGTYIWLLPKGEVKKECVKDPWLARAFEDKDTLECGYCLRIKKSAIKKDEVSTVETWYPSISDLFAEDWQVVE